MQALGKPVSSMGLSLLRDFVPLILLCALKLGVYGSLFSAPFSDIVSFLAVIAVMGYYKNYSVEEMLKLLHFVLEKLHLMMQENEKSNPVRGSNQGFLLFFSQDCVLGFGSV
ncbi:MAG: hypothetical protein ACI4EH_08290 [Oliverpabstia sp.]